MGGVYDVVDTSFLLALIPNEMQGRVNCVFRIVAFGIRPVTLAIGGFMIAALGAIFYLVMDIGIHWGVLRYLHEEVGAKPLVLVTAIILDIIVLAAFLAIKVQADILIVVIALIGLVAVFAGEWLFLRSQ